MAAWRGGRAIGWARPAGAAALAVISVHRMTWSRYRISRWPSTLSTPPRCCGRRVTALPLELQEAVVIAHDPVIGDGPVFFQPKHGVEAQPARGADVKVVRRRRRRAKRALWSAQYFVSRKVFAVAISAMPFRRSFFTSRSCWVP